MKIALHIASAVLLIIAFNFLNEVIGEPIFEYRMDYLGHDLEQLGRMFFCLFMSGVCSYHAK